MFDQPKSPKLISSLNLKEKLALIGSILGVGIVIYSIYMIWTTANQTEVLENLNELRVTDSTQIARKLVVDIGGAVVKPGVYDLEQESRVSHLVNKAEGFSKLADSYYIAHDLNLAAKLTDGQKIYIPFSGEMDQSVQLSKSDERSNGAISINSATKNELDSLEGIGEVRAEAIISNRPYQLLSDLVTKKVLTQTQFETIEKYLIL